MEKRKRFIIFSVAISRTELVKPPTTNWIIDLKYSYEQGKAYAQEWTQLFPFFFIFLAPPQFAGKFLFILKFSPILHHCPPLPTLHSGFATHSLFTFSHSHLLPFPNTHKKISEKDLRELTHDNISPEKYINKIYGDTSTQDADKHTSFSLYG